MKQLWYWGRARTDREQLSKALGSEQEVIDKTVYDFFHKELAAQYDADDRAIIESGQPLMDREEQIIDGNGRQIWVSTSKTPLRDAQGRVVGLVGRGRDITARKQVQEALARERHLLNTLMETTPDHIYFKDEESRFIQVSRAQANLFALKDPAEAIGKTDFDFFTTEHAQQADVDEQEIVRAGRPKASAQRWSRR
jgi:PAS domain S-box-containing protein